MSRDVKALSRDQTNVRISKLHYKARNHVSYNYAYSRDSIRFHEAGVHFQIIKSNVRYLLHLIVQQQQILNKLLSSALNLSKSMCEVMFHYQALQFSSARLRELLLF